MANPEEINQDIKEYLDNHDDAPYNDKLKALRAIFDKHYVLDQVDHKVTVKDLKEILDYAKWLLPKTTTPMKVSGQTLVHEEMLRVVILESIVVYLNNRNLLRKTVKVDYRE